MDEVCIRNQYLAPDGGSFVGAGRTREVSWDHLNMIQRKHMAVPPDINLTEREGLIRYQSKTFYAYNLDLYG